MDLPHDNSFESLEEAINYRTHCPCCHEPLQISKEVEDLTTQSLDFGDEYICIRSIDYSLFLIDIKAETVRIILPNFDTHSMGAHHNGMIYCSYMKICNKCEQYNFRLILSLNLDEKIVLLTSVNSEFIAFEHNYIFHEIKNNYVRKETEYRDDKMPSPIMLPLIMIDFDNPLNTLARINKIKSLI